jgi:hypothetical protein
VQRSATALTGSPLGASGPRSRPTWQFPQRVAERFSRTGEGPASIASRPLALQASPPPTLLRREYLDVVIADEAVADLPVPTGVGLPASLEHLAILPS